MYPEFAHELEDESGVNVDLRSDGTLLFPAPEHPVERITGASPLPRPLADLEPGLNASGRTAVFLGERSVCPRSFDAGGAEGGQAPRRGCRFGEYGDFRGCIRRPRFGRNNGQERPIHAGTVVNCAGAWAGRIRPLDLPSRPVKGQMVCFVDAAARCSSDMSCGRRKSI